MVSTHVKRRLTS